MPHDLFLTPSFSVNLHIGFLYKTNNKWINLMLKNIKDSPKLGQLKTLYPNTNVIVIIFAIIMLWRGFWGLSSFIWTISRLII